MQKRARITQQKQRHAANLAGRRQNLLHPKVVHLTLPRPVATIIKTPLPIQPPVKRSLVRRIARWLMGR